MFFPKLAWILMWDSTTIMMLMTTLYNLRDVVHLSYGFLWANKKFCLYISFWRPLTSNLYGITAPSNLGFTVSTVCALGQLLEAVPLWQPFLMQGWFEMPLWLLRLSVTRLFHQVQLEGRDIDMVEELAGAQQCKVYFPVLWDRHVVLD